MTYAITNYFPLLISYGAIDGSVFYVQGQIKVVFVLTTKHAMRI
jgi:hypothetical protein